MTSGVTSWVCTHNTECGW